MSDPTRHASRTHPVQMAASIVGAVFLLVGILGFVPAVTSNHEQLLVAGHESEALLLGLFQVSILHNLVHLGFGIAGVVLSRTAPDSRNFLLYGGAVYLVLWVYGLVIGHDSAANLVPVNDADNWLHLGLGVGMMALGALLGRRRSATTGS